MPWCIGGPGPWLTLTPRAKCTKPLCEDQRPPVLRPPSYQEHLVFLSRQVPGGVHYSCTPERAPALMSTGNHQYSFSVLGLLKGLLCLLRLSQGRTLEIWPQMGPPCPASEIAKLVRFETF